jgi:hypothetical protein
VTGTATSCPAATRSSSRISGAAPAAGSRNLDLHRAGFSIDDLDRPEVLEQLHHLAVRAEGRVFWLDVSLYRLNAPLSETSRDDLFRRAGDSGRRPGALPDFRRRLRRAEIPRRRAGRRLRAALLRRL